MTQRREFMTLASKAILVATAAVTQANALPPDEEEGQTAKPAKPASSKEEQLNAPGVQSPPSRPTPTTHRPERTHAEEQRQYEVCKQRGHVADPTMPASMPNPPTAPQGYVAQSETPWQTCYYCGKDWRYMTKIEERQHEG